MTYNEKLTRLLTFFLCITFITAGFSLSFTFSGSPEAPDATATYTKNRLTWDVPVNEKGVAGLNIFGEPADGEQYPVIHPLSGDTYHLRLKNDVSGIITYNIYLYCENQKDVPLKFNLTETDDMKAIPDGKYPTILRDSEVLAAYTGHVGGKNLKNFEIEWHWETESDEKDTQIGNRAVYEDLLYTIRAMIIIEDNNVYQTVGGGGGGSGGGKATGTVSLYHRLYMRGYPEGDFRPGAGISRAETAAIFARILANYDESVMTKTATAFSDVPSDKWYSKYIAFLENKDIISGYPDGTFGPDKKITRAEFTAICSRYVEKLTGKIEPANISFKDFSSAHWAYEYMRKAVGQQWVLGFPDGTVRADSKISRAEVVTIMNRILERSADKEYVDSHTDELVRFTDVTDKTYWAYYEIYEASNDHYFYTVEDGESWFK